MTQTCRAIGEAPLCGIVRRVASASLGVTNTHSMCWSQTMPWSNHVVNTGAPPISTLKSLFVGAI